MGEKDFQQLYLIKKFIKKIYKSKVYSCKTIRDKNYIPNLKEILKMNKRGNRIVKVLEFSGVFMSFLLYLIALSLRSKFIADKILKKLL